METTENYRAHLGIATLDEELERILHHYCDDEDIVAMMLDEYHAHQRKLSRCARLNEFARHWRKFNGAFPAYWQPRKVETMRAALSDPAGFVEGKEE